MFVHFWGVFGGNPGSQQGGGMAGQKRRYSYCKDSLPQWDQATWCNNNGNIFGRRFRAVKIQAVSHDDAKVRKEVRCHAAFVLHTVGPAIKHPHCCFPPRMYSAR